MSETLLVPLEDIDSLAEGEMRLYQAGVFEVVVCRVQGALYAVENKCSHQARPLVRGRLRQYRLICPVHGAAFDVRDGSHTSPPAFCGISSFPVMHTEQGVCIEVPQERAKPTADPFSNPQMMRTR